jgi:hypothetical protein
LIVRVLLFKKPSLETYANARNYYLRRSRRDDMGWKATPTCASQYGLPVLTGSPQNQKSSVAGSPTGHLQVRSVNSIRPIFLDFFSTSLTLASASGLISFADG